MRKPVSGDAAPRHLAECLPHALGRPVLPIKDSPDRFSVKPGLPHKLIAERLLVDLTVGRGFLVETMQMQMQMQMQGKAISKIGGDLTERARRTIARK
ncbi:MAG TPA: hypothetical protein VEI26_01720 [Terriglobales bacterium]|nr:hypothetical protein [Terriglobales bacterium]